MNGGRHKNVAYKMEQEDKRVEHERIIKFNHERPVEDFTAALNLIRAVGFTPIAVTQLYAEDTFVFRTKAEANRAFRMFESTKPSKLVGWWFGAADFIKALAKYEREYETKVLVHYLVTK